MIDRLPPQSLEAEQSVLGAHPDRPRCRHRGRGVPAPGGLLPAGERPDLRGRARPVRATRADRHRHRRRVARAPGRARSHRWARLPVEPLERDADGGPRRPVRADRRAQGGPAQPDRRGRAGSPGSATRTRPRSRRRSTAPRPSSSRSARSASMPGSARSSRSSTTPTTGSTTSTPTAARSAACGPASPTSTR